MQLAELGVALKKPGEVHAVHVRFEVEVPGLLMYVPAAQVANAVQDATLAVAGVALPLATLKVPAAQAVQARSFCAEPGVLTYVPWAQLVIARQVRLAGVLN